MRRYAVLPGLLTLCACASIIDGSEQKITVNTNPMGADCVLNRRTEKEGPETPIARINPTPGDATVQKTKYDISIVCNKPGYQTATFVNHSGNEGSTLGNIIAGGGIGWAVDSARGADNKYESPVNMTLIPAQQVAPAYGTSYPYPYATSPQVSVPPTEARPVYTPR